MSAGELAATVIKSVTLRPDEARRLWEVCRDLGYRQWAPCLRHLIMKCVEVRCWESVKV